MERGVRFGRVQPLIPPFHSMIIIRGCLNCFRFHCAFLINLIIKLAKMPVIKSAQCQDEDEEDNNVDDDENGKRPLQMRTLAGQVQELTNCCKHE